MKKTDKKIKEKIKINKSDFNWYENEKGIRCMKPVKLKICEFEDCMKEGKYKDFWNLCGEHLLAVNGVRKEKQKYILKQFNKKAI